MLNEHKYAIQYSPKAVRYMQHVFPSANPKSSTQTASPSLQPFLQDSLGDRQTDRPTDHATRSVTRGGAHTGEAKLCYCLPESSAQTVSRLLQPFLPSSRGDRLTHRRTDHATLSVIISAVELGLKT